MLALAIADPMLPLSEAYTIDPKHQLVEGLASDGTTLFVSSVLDRTIIACTDTCRDVIRLDGPAVPLGMSWDKKRKLLWVAMHCPALPGVGRCTGEVRGVTVAGRVKYRLWPSSSFSPGDISVVGKSIVVSDSGSGQIYRLTPEKRRWEKLILSGEMKSAQGVAALEDGSILAADYTKGISRIDPKSGKRTMILLDDGKPLRGIDGMVPDRIYAYGIYNGSVPGKLLELNVYGKVLRTRELADLTDPTQIAVRGLNLYAVADSGWSLIDQKKPRTQGAKIVSVRMAIWD